MNRINRFLIFLLQTTLFSTFVVSVLLIAAAHNTNPDPALPLWIKEIMWQIRLLNPFG